LEKAVIRAAAVSALAAFAHSVASLHESIVLLLEKCLNDSDDEVRERAHFYYTMLTGGSTKEDSSDALGFNDQIDVEALEAYVLQNRETLCEESSNSFEIDVSSMRQALQVQKSSIPIQNTQNAAEIT
jgi:coatomer subunit gamma